MHARCNARPFQQHCPGRRRMASDLPQHSPCVLLPPVSSSGRATASTFIPESDGFVNGIYYVHMKVRDTELDQFSVVNNAVYMSYVQHARHCALADMGMSVQSFQEEGTLMALSQCTLKYKAPLRSGDAFVATAAIAKVGGARVAISHEIILCNSGQQAEQVVEGTAEVVFLDASYRPMRVPPRAKGPLQQRAAEYAAAQAAAEQQPQQQPQQHQGQPVQGLSASNGLHL